jgi:hypothetical protein
MQGTHDEVRHAEGYAVGTERLGHRKRHDEHRGDRPEHGEPDGSLFRVEGVRQPGVRGPGPPQRTKQEQAPEETAPRRIAGKEPGDLRDGEHDNEVEEQLEGRYPSLASDVSIVHPEVSAFDFLTSQETIRRGAQIPSPCRHDPDV